MCALGKTNIKQWHLSDFNTLASLSVNKDGVLQTKYLLFHPCGPNSVILGILITVRLYFQLFQWFSCPSRNQISSFVFFIGNVLLWPFGYILLRPILCRRSKVSEDLLACKSSVLSFYFWLGQKTSTLVSESSFKLLISALSWMNWLSYQTLFVMQSVDWKCFS